MLERVPSIYLDTCIVRDVLGNRRDASIDLIHRIRNGNWQCNMSVFALMELVDIEQESLFVHKKHFVDKMELEDVFHGRKHRDLLSSELQRSSRYIEQFLENYSFIELIRLDDENWDTAVVTAANSNLNAPDVIHLISAYQADSDVIVTDDTFFISEAERYLKDEQVSKPRICKPEDCISILKEMGFSNI